MQCPTCNVALSMSDRNGIEIDYCPQCRGVWLDRGELDKLIERAGADDRPQQRQQSSSNYREDDDDDDRYERRDRYDEHRDDRNYNEYHDDRNHAKKHKKEGFLGDLFDF